MALWGRLAEDGSKHHATGVQGLNQPLTAGTSDEPEPQGLAHARLEHIADVARPLVIQQHALLVDPVFWPQQDDVHRCSAADVFCPELRLLLLHGLHQLFAVWIVQACDFDPSLLEPGLGPLKGLALSDDHPPESQQNGRSGAHRTGREGGDQGQLTPVAAPPGVADALGFTMAGGIPVLDPLVVSTGDDRSILLGQDGADGNSPFAPAPFGFGPGRIDQTLHRAAIDRTSVPLAQAWQA